MNLLRLSLRWTAILACFVTAPAIAADEPAEAPLPDGLYAEIATPRGTLVAELFFTRAPLTVANFVGLAEGQLGPMPRRPFYDGLTFHRVVPGFVVQGGDPLGTGEGGPGYEFPDEFVPGLRHDTAGVLSMANGGPDTNGSQFFLTLAPVNRLNYLHSVFGRVVRGLEVLPQIQQGDVITKVTIHRVGSAAQAFRVDTAEFTRLAGQAPRARLPHFDDPENLLPRDPPRAKAFDAKLANFARATGVRLYARLLPKFTPETPGQRAGSFVGVLAQQWQLGADAVLVVYFADTQQWGLWIGDARLPKFMGRAGTVAEFTREGALHQAKQELLTVALADAARTIEIAEKAAGPERPLLPGQRIKLQFDAVLDALIFRFEA
ncbi:peptidylprolyl isomerase [Opitutus terrae]|uniref:peptidylprolyl isomerase n=1 Tax=Opitutus terrae (strain DSM 11246 / JCM 15787 / PB90-1) TaxID=452637 RepID=B1ZSS2_OPITP|nr:peptidylprolyl isomerase [Opitutus terrae]ACB74766.1 Peptidylprolyl isomerase [Opitutus terrae PB90-1]